MENPGEDEQNLRGHSFDVDSFLEGLDRLSSDEPVEAEVQKLCSMVRPRFQSDARSRMGLMELVLREDHGCFANASWTHFKRTPTFWTRTWRWSWAD